MTGKSQVMTGLLLGVAVTLLLSVVPVSAKKMYKYTDAAGNLHVVDDYEKVPLRYRKQIEIRQSTVSDEAPPVIEGSEGLMRPPEGSVPVPSQPPAEGGAAPADGSAADGKDKEKEKKKGLTDRKGNDEAYWRDRFGRCDQALENAKNRLTRLEASAGSGNDSGSAEIARQIGEARQKVQSQQQECSALREEARRAGAPAGWLR